MTGSADRHANQGGVIDLTEGPPPAVARRLSDLQAALELAIPPKRLDHNLLVATWNLRAFGGLTERWESGPDDSPKRDLGALACIAEIVARFDVVAVQEVKGDLTALRRLLDLLGPDWSFVLTDVTRGAAGNDERMAFVFDSRRAVPSGLACELVLPAEWDGVPIGGDAGQFARTPYAVSFLSAGRSFRATFILVTLHVLYGDGPADRTAELGAIAHWLAEEARDVHAYDQNLIALGDFNIDRVGDPNYEAFVSSGLRVPDSLLDLPRTLPSAGGGDKHYDQIAWFTGDGGVPALSLRAGGGGNFDFAPLFGDMSVRDLSWRLSDHYPLWVEFLVAPGEDRRRTRGGAARRAALPPGTLGARRDQAGRGRAAASSAPPVLVER